VAVDRVLLLVGGVGGAKLAHGLAQILPPGALTAVVNTGDDFWHYGLRVCPDIDTVMYTLGGIVDPINGWGVREDTAHMLDAMRRYGEQPWFRLGDQDVATHLLRTEALRRGEPLTDITRRLSTALGIQQHILPMTDSEFATIVDTVEYGELAFQEYFVRHRWQPRVRRIRFAGAETAQMTEAVADAFAAADVILIAPSNPWLSVAPILNVPGMRDQLLNRRVPCAALTPIIGGAAVKGPTAKIMDELGYAVTAETVARFYDGLIDGFVYDAADPELCLPGVRTIRMDALMRSESDRARLAGEMLGWIAEAL
jgi:LPPG:FO 2-phospho-L-lactate transferase